MLTALLASLFAVLLMSPAAFAQGPGDDQYGCGVGGCDEEPGSGGNTGGGSNGGGNTGGGNPAGGGTGAGSGAGLGPDASTVSAGSGAAGGSGAAAGGDTTSGTSSTGETSGPATITAASSEKASKKLKDHSLGEVLSGGTGRVASAKPASDAGSRAAKAVEDGGGAGLLWLLLALGAITAVAAGAVAVRRRQARQGYMR